MNTRPATSDDYEFVFQVKVDALKEYIAQTWGWDDSIQREFHERNFTPENMQIIRHDDADAGFLAVEEMEDEIRLNEINLLQRFQRKGIATEIIQRIQGEAAAKGKRVWLQVLKVNPAIRLYERLGFTVYAETETHDKMTYGERRLPKVATKLPTPVPQIPVSDLARAISFYQSRLGFVLDWKHDNGIAGVSRDGARLFLNRVVEFPLYPVRVWLNFDSVSEVDDLHREWQKAGVTIPSAPEQKPWGIYEFIAEDCDGNSYRVFHDTETPKQKRS